MLDAGGRVILETRHFHEDTGTTTSGRSKEEAQDYRYFPEPDLVPVAPPAEWVEQIRAALPEAPAARRARLTADWNVSALDMDAIVNAGALDLVEATVAAGASAADARKWWVGELSRRAHDTGTELTALAITPAQVARVSALVVAGTLNDRLARDVIEGVLAGEGDPDEVVEARGLAVVSDDSALSPRSTRPSRPIPRWRPRSATARSPRSASWSARCGRPPAARPTPPASAS